MLHELTTCRLGNDLNAIPRIEVVCSFVCLASCVIPGVSTHFSIYICVVRAYPGPTMATLHGCPATTSPRFRLARCWLLLGYIFG